MCTHYANESITMEMGYGTCSSASAMLYVFLSLQAITFTWGSWIALKRVEGGEVMQSFSLVKALISLFFGFYQAGFVCFWKRDKNQQNCLFKCGMLMCAHHKLLMPISTLLKNKNKTLCYGQWGALFLAGFSSTYIHKDVLFPSKYEFGYIKYFHLFLLHVSLISDVYKLPKKIILTPPKATQLLF